jgi:outer membrane lipopolysaccharide assembly protein LptE/RlpB
LNGPQRSNLQLDVARIGIAACGFELKGTRMTEQSRMEAKSFHIHNLDADVARMIQMHADIVEMAIRRYRKERR